MGWIETNKQGDDHSSCPICRKKVCFADIESIGVNKLLESCINMYISTLTETNETVSYKKRQKKMAKHEQFHNFVKNHKKTPKFKSIRTKINEILKPCNGVMKYEEMVEQLILWGFDKTDLDLFLVSQVKKNTGLVLVGDFVLDVWEYDNINCDLGKYLQANPKELLYLLLHDAISDNNSHLVSQYLLPQSEFFKEIVNEKKAKKALYAKYNANAKKE
jgi:hypothetical protein